MTEKQPKKGLLARLIGSVNPEPPQPPRRQTGETPSGKKVADAHIREWKKSQSVLTAAAVTTTIATTPVAPTEVGASNPTLNDSKESKTTPLAAFTNVAESTAAASPALPEPKAVVSPVPEHFTKACMVRTMTNKPIIVHYSDDATVRDLKQALYAETQQPPETQRLVLAGKILIDEQVLTLISELNTVHMVIDRQVKPTTQPSAELQQKWDNEAKARKEALQPFLAILHQHNTVLAPIYAPLQAAGILSEEDKARLLPEWEVERRTFTFVGEVGQISGLLKKTMDVDQHLLFVKLAACVKANDIEQVVLLLTAIKSYDAAIQTIYADPCNIKVTQSSGNSARLLDSEQFYSVLKSAAETAETAVRFCRGWLAEQAADQQNAISNYQACAETYPQAYRHLGNIYFSLGRTELDPTKKLANFSAAVGAYNNAVNNAVPVSVEKLNRFLQEIDTNIQQLQYEPTTAGSFKELKEMLQVVMAANVPLLARVEQLRLPITPNSTAASSNSRSATLAAPPLSVVRGSPIHTGSAATVIAESQIQLIPGPSASATATTPTVPPKL
jgi:tetratricopeptide (TPR) repeat protein